MIVLVQMALELCLVVKVQMHDFHLLHKHIIRKELKSSVWIVHPIDYIKII